MSIAYLQSVTTYALRYTSLAGLEVLFICFYFIESQQCKKQTTKKHFSCKRWRYANLMKILIL